MKHDGNLEKQITHDETVTRDVVMIRDENGDVHEVEVAEDEND